MTHDDCERIERVFALRRYSIHGPGCVFDNPRSGRREVWLYGARTTSASIEELERYASETGRHVEPWESGRYRGNRYAVGVFHDA